jgi:hypothetical protein
MEKGRAPAALHHTRRWIDLSRTDALWNFVKRLTNQEGSGIRKSKLI